MKKRYAWILRKAGLSCCHKEYELYGIDASYAYYSSLKKCREEVKKVVESGEIGSYENWTAEKWQSKNYCVVINSGGCGIFAIKRILLN
jgi:hypothetical protein